MYSAELAAVKANHAQWTRVFGPEAKITGFSLHDDYAYLLTYRDAPRFKIVRTSMVKPDIAGATPRVIIGTQHRHVRPIGRAQACGHFEGMPDVDP